MVPAKAGLSSDLSQNASPVAKCNKITLQNATANAAKNDIPMLQKTTKPSFFCCKMRRLSRLISRTKPKELERLCGREAPMACGWYGLMMKPASRERRAMADEHYEEIGRSLAALVVETGMGPGKAWSLLGGVGLYRRWMLDLWIERYREEGQEERRKSGSASRSLNKRKSLLDELRRQPRG